MPPADPPPVAPAPPLDPAPPPALPERLYQVPITDIAAAAGEDWPEVASSPPLLDAFARACVIGGEVQEQPTEREQALAALRRCLTTLTEIYETHAERAAIQGDAIGDDAAEALVQPVFRADLAAAQDDLLADLARYGIRPPPRDAARRAGP